MSLFAFVKSHVAILDIAGQYVRLKQAGTYWKGSCPFHHETDASFTVSPDKGIFYCFGCHAGGDAIAFVAKAERLSQIEAVQHLVERYGLTVPEELLTNSKQQSARDKDQKEMYFHLCQEMALYCYEQLKRSGPAINYLKTRGIDEQHIKYFTLGYFPGGAGSVQKFVQEMARKHILLKDLLACHVLMQGAHAPYSPYEERIIFPIHDALGRTCGFGGRVFKKNDTRPKYYNSKEHLHFAKGKLLFHYDKAKKAMQEQQAAYLVEGYTDVVAMVKHGHTNVVATLGTACTTAHLKAIARQVSRLYVLYDGDSAGQKAILRLAELCFEANLELYIVTLPTNHDPASFLEKGGDLARLRAEARDIFSFFVDSLGSSFSTQSLAGKLEVSKKILEMIGRIDDSFKRDLLLQQAAARLQVPLETLRETLKTQQNIRTSEDDNSPEQHQERFFGLSTLEQQALFAIIHNVERLEEIGQQSELVADFSQKAHDFLEKLWTRALNTSPSERLSALLEVSNEEEQRLLSAASLWEGAPKTPEGVRNLVRGLKRERYKEQVRQYKRKLVAAQKEKNQEQYTALMKEFLALQQLMKSKGVL